MTYLIPYSQFRGLNRLRREMDDLWGRFFDTGEAPLTASGDFVPSVNVRETEKAFEVTAEVPGLKPEDIKVEFHEGVLTLSGEKNEEAEKQEGSWHVMERRFGSFSRSMRLPRDIDIDKLEATHRDGVLKVVLPKSAKAAGKTIEVKAG
ncbi:MAG: Hsp20/alpha crystallin family protein [Thermodesulfobacteriota bacterium]